MRADPRPADERLFAGLSALAAALVSAIAVAAAPGHRVEVGALCAVAVAAYVVALRWRPPTPLLLVWTYGPPVVLVAAGRGEGIVFLLLVAVSFLGLVEDDPRVRVAAGLVALATPAAIQLAAPTHWGWPYWTGGLLVTWLSTEQMRRFRALVAELEATRERLAAQAVHLERRRIAAELHDLVGHSLGVLLLHVTGARRRIADDPAGATEALVRAESIGRAGLAEIRRSVAALRDEAGTALAPSPVAADVPDLVAESRAAGCPVGLEVTGDLAAVEPMTGLAVYRVVQESLANAVRHAPGAAVTVAVAVGPAAVGVTVRDAGGGGGPRSAAGVGLVGMRERVQALGGTVTAGPVPPGGWQVHAVLPRAAADSPAGLSGGGAAGGGARAGVGG